MDYYCSQVWLLILASLIIVGPIIHCIMKLRSKLCGESRVYPLASCIWFVYGALMKQGSSLSPVNGIGIIKYTVKNTLYSKNFTD